jgi:microcystin-dependent protein
MAAIDFPNSPTNGQVHSVAGKNWLYNGTTWTLVAVAVTAGVSSVNGNTGVVTGIATTDSPTFTGTVTIPAGASISGFAPLSSPALTGTPTAPTAAIGTSNTQVATTAFVAFQASPIGMITAFAGATAPTGWQLCYGQAISRTTYASLFTVLGTTYGAGDGSTTFNLPDLRGRTVAGVDNMGGTDAGILSSANNLGEKVGAETVTLATTDIPSHGHTPTVTNNAVTSGAGSSHGHTPTVTNNAVNTGNQSADHSHTFGTGGASVDHSHTTNGGGAHSHNIGLRTGAATSTHNNTNEASAAGGTYVLSAGPIAGVGDHTHTTGGHSADHSHSGTTAGMNVSHTHAVTSNVAVTNATESAHTHSVTSNVTVTNANTGGGGAHNNMQPTIVVNYIILAGV